MRILTNASSVYIYLDRLANITINNNIYTYESQYLDEIIINNIRDNTHVCMILLNITVSLNRHRDISQQLSMTFTMIEKSLPKTVAGFEMFMPRTISVNDRT